jgi:hypothetical protein
METYFTTDKPIVAFSKDATNPTKFSSLATESGVTNLDNRNAKAKPLYNKLNKLGAYNSVVKPHIRIYKPYKVGNYIRDKHSSVMTILGYKRSSVPGITPMAPILISNSNNNSRLKKQSVIEEVKEEQPVMQFDIQSWGEDELE